MTERTNVRVLHPEAAAAAAANLIDRWALGELPRTHLDTADPAAATSGCSCQRSEGFGNPPVAPTDA